MVALGLAVVGRLVARRATTGRHLRMAYLLAGVALVLVLL